MASSDAADGAVITMSNCLDVKNCSDVDGTVVSSEYSRLMVVSDDAWAATSIGIGNMPRVGVDPVGVAVV